jgi:DNA-binding transcriptional LysR family regulator
VRIDRPSISELECFLAAAEELNFSRAAGRLNLSQPAFSRQIQALEAKLGFTLFDRSTRTVTPTAAGLIYLEDISPLLTRLDNATDAARRAALGETLRLRIAFVGALLDEELVETLSAFRLAHPNCQIHLRDLPPASQLEAIQNGELDGGFIGARPHRLPRGLSTLVWKSEPLVFALPPSHPLAKRKLLSLSSLSQEKWVMVSRVAAPAFRRQFDHLCKTFRPQIIHESDRVTAVLPMVAAELGISLLPKSVCRLLKEGVRFIPMKTPKSMLEHTFAYRENFQSPELQGLISLLSKAG